MSEPMDVKPAPVPAAEAGGRCRFPVGWDAEAHDFQACGRPTVPVKSEDGRGRPTGYCDDPQHRRERASGERRRIRRGIERAAPEDLGRPVTHARAEGEHFLDQVRKVAEPLTENLGRLLEAIDSMTDPELVAEQLAITAKDHQLEKAQLEARLTKAERAERELSARLEESEAEAENSTTQAELALWLYAEATHRLADKERHVESLTAKVEAATERADSLDRQLQAEIARAENGEQVAAWLLAEERHRAATEIHEVQETAREEVEQAQRQADEEIARAGREADQRIRTIENEAEEKVQDADRARAEALRGQHEAELKAAKATQAAEDWRREAGTASATAERLRGQMDELRASYDQQLDTLRRNRDEDLRAAREDARAERERLETAYSRQVEGLNQALEATRTALESLGRREQYIEPESPDHGSSARE
ncbi:hypothetical protein ACWDO0_28065 [Nocardia rhamnosiphila]